MDAFGNLTEEWEFSGDRRLRLISYLDPDVSIGVFPPDGRLCVHRISGASPEISIFTARPWQSRGVMGAGFCLVSYRSKTALDGWRTLPQSDQAWVYEWTPSLINPDSTPDELIVKFVDGCWFQLKNPRQRLVVDCGSSDISEGNPILFWEENGGDNQKWRAATTGPGLTT